MADMRMPNAKMRITNRNANPMILLQALSHDNGDQISLMFKLNFDRNDPTFVRTYSPANSRVKRAVTTRRRRLRKSLAAKMDTAPRSCK